MRHIVHKAFWAWNFDKEEKWLNDMAAKGLCLASVGWCRYDFEDCLPGEYAIRFELLEHVPSHPESRKYIAFIEDTGAEHIGSVQRWVYFRKKTADGPFDLYSDSASRIKHLNRILTLVGVLGAVNLYIGCYNLYLYFSMDSAFNICGLVNLAIALGLGWGCRRLWVKRRKAQKEQRIFE